MEHRRQQWELLTEEEKQFLKPIEAIQATIISKYQYMDGNKAKTQAIIDLLNEDFKTMCGDQEIDMANAVRIALKLYTDPWYCYFISDVQENAGEWQNVFSLCTSQNPRRTKKLSPEKYPEFYAATWNANTDPDTAYPAILDGLKLPHTFKYIGPIEFETLATIAELYTTYDTNYLIPRTGGRRIKSIEYAVDKVNRGIWDTLTAQRGPDGQLGFSFFTGKVGKNGRKSAKDESIAVLYSMSFAELETTKDLSYFDKRIYFVAGSLAAANNGMFTPQQLYSAMGLNGTAGQHDREKIHNALMKMRKIWIKIDNNLEVNAGYAYPDLSYEGYMLPLELIKATVNGQSADYVYRLLREPPMISFARGRKQITTIDRKLLATPVNKTNITLGLEDYLISEISRARKGSRKNRERIAFNTMFQELHLTGKQQQRAKSQIEKILNHYKSCEFITDFKMDEDGVTFSIPRGKELGKPSEKT